MKNSCVEKNLKKGIYIRVKNAHLYWKPLGNSSAVANSYTPNPLFLSENSGGASCSKSGELP